MRRSRCTRRDRTVWSSPIATAWPATSWPSVAADWKSLVLGPLAHQRLALAFGDDLAALVGGGVVEFDDAGVGPRLALAHAQHGSAHLERVAVEHRLGELHVGHAEIGDCRADRGVVDRDADHQSEGE